LAAPSGAANPGRPVLADGWADFFLVFDVGAGSELWGRLGHDRIYRPVGEAYLEYAERFAENDTDTSVRKRCR
jgi:hypothetical protein